MFKYKGSNHDWHKQLVAKATTPKVQPKQAARGNTQSKLLQRRTSR